MASMTPDRPSQRRRLTSPLHELDDDVVEEIPETPAEDEMLPANMSPQTMAQIIRNEIHQGLAPLQIQLTDFSTNVSSRLGNVENHLMEHDVKIEKLEQMMHSFGSNTTTPRSTDSLRKIEEHEKELADLKAQFSSFKIGQPHVQQDVAKTMVIGGLQQLKSLQEATTWLGEKLKDMNGPSHCGTYMKSSCFQGLLFAKFRSVYDRDTAVALLRSDTIMMGEKRVWATQDLPLQTRARKMFLLGLRWQLGQWGFVKREMVIDENYDTLSIEGKVIVKIVISQHDLDIQWADEWARWQEFQECQELVEIGRKSKAVLEKRGKGGGKSKAAMAAH
jgi:hypothetical protein